MTVTATAIQAQAPLPAMSSTERMKLSRERKRQGLQCVTIEIRSTEIATLVKRGFLMGDQTKDRAAIRGALHAFMEANL